MSSDTERHETNDEDCCDDGLPDPAWSTPLLLDVLGHQIGDAFLYTFLCNISHTLSSTGIKSHKFEGHCCLLAFARFRVVQTVQYRLASVSFCKVKSQH